MEDEGRNPSEWSDLDSLNCLGLAGQLGLLLLVSLDMFEEVVRPHEWPTAGGADELLLPGVGPLVAGELVAPGEDPVTVLIRTVERLLSYKYLQLEGLAYVASFRIIKIYLQITLYSPILLCSVYLCGL